MSSQIEDKNTDDETPHAYAEADDAKETYERIRVKVLSEAWQALRDEKDEPMIEAMNVIAKLMEK